VIETVRSLARHRRGPAAAEASRPATLPAPSMNRQPEADPGLRL
jgi:hypothetical protein